MIKLLDQSQTEQRATRYLVTFRLALSATSGGKESSTTGGGEEGEELSAIPTAPLDKIDPLWKSVTGRPVIKGVEEAMRESCTPSKNSPDVDKGVRRKMDRNRCCDITDLVRLRKRTL